MTFDPDALCACGHPVKWHRYYMGSMEADGCTLCECTERFPHAAAEYRYGLSAEPLTETQQAAVDDMLAGDLATQTPPPKPPIIDAETMARWDAEDARWVAIEWSEGHD